MIMGSDYVIHAFNEKIAHVRWQDFNDDVPENTWEWYYAEERLYVIRHKQQKYVYLVKANSPADAFQRLKRRFVSGKADV